MSCNQTLSRKEMDIKLNAVNFKIWGIMQDRVYVHKITSVDGTKQRISDEWEKIDQQLIDSTIKQWRNRLACSLCFCTRRTHRAHALKQKSKLINSLQE